MNGTPRAARENISAVAQLEEDHLTSRSLSDRLADAVASFVGSVTFVFLHLLLFVTWFLVNLGWLGLAPFDPYPFVLLTLIVSAEGVLLSTFVLIKQNRMSQAADHRAHLNLQIDLLAEKEITKILQLQTMVCDRLGIHQVHRDTEVAELSRETAVDTLAQELRKRIPAEGVQEPHADR